MNQTKTERFIIILVSLTCIGLTLESILMGWEFWVPPIIILGTVSLWVMTLTEKPDYSVREVYYFIYAMFTALYHGVHETSFFDIALVIVLVMVGFSFFNHIYMMNMTLIEFFILLAVQFVLSYKGGERVYDALTISRICLHCVIVLLVYFSCTKAITDRNEAKIIDREKDERIEAYDADMEDFLSNISHELRTPVNVVNGMSDLLIKRNVGYEAEAIKNAGIRLTYQIDDIQDYTECKRRKLLLEEEDYICTSLINDVVTSFRMLENAKKLELVVDLSPTVPTVMRGDIKKLHKIFRHLLENAVKFTKRGGIYVKMYSEATEGDEYGVNLCIEMTDTGIGMDRKARQSIFVGMYQANKKRNRSSGGIGLGLFIVYGLAHSMGGFVKIESEKRVGTTVRVTIPQRVIDDTPCLSINGSYDGDILFHVRAEKYKVPQVRDFYRAMASNLAYGIHVPLYSADSIKEIERLIGKLNVKTIFMGQEEYESNPEYFDKLSKGDIVVAVSAANGFKVNAGSNVMVMPKPLYGYPVVKILNEGRDAGNLDFVDNISKPVFTGVRALIVDDEPMNLVVATGLFKDYEMVIDTAASGKEAIEKYKKNDYDIVFMDHMMPEMDGVQAMKHIKEAGLELHKNAIVIALTANTVSGAREMFFSEGFDGFIGKPINISEFERVMMRVLPKSQATERGDKA
ncbi:MAG: response regulator [Lachnospiraceae bacterium]|nr:response regulator [Lachnospiraceae bacterium]